MTGYESKKHMAQDKLNKAIEPHTTTFHNIKSDWVMPDWVMRITADRRIEVNEGVEVTEAAQKVLDALQNLLKPAQPEQEPVLWMMPDGKTADKWALQFYGGQAGKPLYTTPPRRTWVGLTDEETLGFTQHEMSVVKYVNKVLQEKNT